MRILQGLFESFSRVQARLTRGLIEILGISDHKMELLLGGEFVSHETFEILSKYSEASTQTSQHPRDDIREQMNFPERYLYKIHNIALDSLTGTIFTTKARIIPESSTWPRAHLLLNSPPKPIFPKRTVFPLEVTVLHLPSNGFFHWLFEDLPPYLFALEASKNPVTLVSDSAPNFVIGLLPLISGEVVRVPRFVSTKSLTFVSKGPNTGWPDPADIQTISRFFAKHIQPTIPTKKIYISRVKASRSPNFEKELICKLSSAGWLILETESMSLINQIETISTAAVICGVHGAGLSGIAWMAPGTTMIELSPNRLIPCYSRICNNTGKFYFRIPYEEQALGVDEIFSKIQSIIG